MTRENFCHGLAAMKEAKAAQEAADLEKSAAAPAVITTEMLESHAIAAPKRRSKMDTEA